MYQILLIFLWHTVWNSMPKYMEISTYANISSVLIESTPIKCKASSRMKFSSSTAKSKLIAMILLIKQFFYENNHLRRHHYFWDIKLEFATKGWKKLQL